jgi:hypothetical protein
LKIPLSNLRFKFFFISIKELQNVNVENGVSLIFRKIQMGFVSDSLYGLGDSSGSPILVYLTGP